MVPLKTDPPKRTPPPSTTSTYSTTPSRSPSRHLPISQHRRLPPVATGRTSDPRPRRGRRSESFFRATAMAPKRLCPPACGLAVRAVRVWGHRSGWLRSSDGESKAGDYSVFGDFRIEALATGGPSWASFLGTRSGCAKSLLDGKPILQVQICSTLNSLIQGHFFRSLERFTRFCYFSLSLSFWPDV